MILHLQKKKKIDCLPLKKLCDEDIVGGWGQPIQNWISRGQRPL